MVHPGGGAGALAVSAALRAPVQRALKRGLDVAAAAGLLLAASPVVALAALAVALEDGGPVFFRQPRAGRGGRTFQVWKFRSLRVHQAPPEAVGQVHGGHALVTRVGGVLRRLKVDELPQLLNVLAGDMSLVGPRPTLPSQVAAYDAFQRRRLEVPAGMTGWAQVNGNTAVTWDERIALDVWYVDHWSLALDLKILLKTAGVVLRGERPAPAALLEARRHEDGARGRGGEHAGGA